MVAIDFDDGRVVGHRAPPQRNFSGWRKNCPSRLEGI